MAVNETVSKGRKYRRLKDVSTKLWERISFWTHASDVEFDDGTTAQTKLGAITGISSSSTANSETVAASTALVNTLSNNLAKKHAFHDVTLANTDVVTAVKYLRDNVAKEDMQDGGQQFNMMVNNMTYFYGAFFSDKTSTYFGTITERGGYSYSFSGSYGADPVLKKLCSAAISGRCAESAAMNDTSHSGTYTYSGLDACNTMVFSNNIPANGYGNVTISGSADGSSYTQLYYTSSASTNVSIDISNYSYIRIAINVYHRAISSHSQWATIGVDWTFS